MITLLAIQLRALRVARALTLFVVLVLSLAYFGAVSPEIAHAAEIAHCGTVSSSQTWTGNGDVHTVGFGCTSVTINTGVTVTIEEGALVKFGIDAWLTVNGALVVQGTEGNEVYFTSIRDDIGGDTDGSPTLPALGDWDTIRFTSFSDPTSIINHAVIRYGGWGGLGPIGGVTLDGASPTIQNTTFTNNAYCAIAANTTSFPTLSGNTLLNNAANGLCLYGGDISSNAMWDVTDTAYYLRGDITVANGATLTVASNVLVKFGGNRRLTVNGRLNVAGTVSQPVYFTSYRDDNIRGEGDTNGDGSTLPALSDWDTIRFTSFSDPTSIIDHAVIRYGGWGGLGPIGGVTLDGASPTIQNTTFTNNAYCAIAANTTSFPTLSGNTLLNNAANGLCLYGGDISSNAMKCHAWPGIVRIGIICWRRLVCLTPSLPIMMASMIYISSMTGSSWA